MVKMGVERTMRSFLIVEVVFKLPNFEDLSFLDRFSQGSRYLYCQDDH